MSAAAIPAPGAPAAIAGAGPGGADATREVDWTRLLLGFGAMVLGQFMAVLDIQIVASSLPQIQAGVSASADEISWVQTAYLIPEVVMIPLSGYLSRLWGTQRLFLVSCLGFMIMSLLTGLSTDIGFMIVTRALQGFIGGAMIPTVFAVAFTAFPPEKRIATSVIMGMIVTLAPTLGPTLGGHLTEWMSWRWLFFINVPIGLVVLFGVWRWADFDKGDPELAKGFDWAGLGLMAVFLMSFQYVLEEGSKNSWFQDETILVLAVIAAITGVAFVWRTLTYWRPIVELKAFANVNFSVGVALTFINGAVLFGGMFLLPLFLGRIRHYSSAEVGSTLFVSGLTMFMIGPLMGRIVRRLDPRLCMFVGYTIVAAGMWHGREITSQWGFWELAGIQASRGAGVMLAMIASQNLTMATLPPAMVKNASGLVNLARNVGGAFALAILSTTLTHQTAVHLHELTENVTANSPGPQMMLNGLTERMSELGVADPDGAGRKAIFMMLEQQAQTLAFGDGFALLGLSVFLGALLTVFAKAPKGPLAAGGEIH